MARTNYLQYKLLLDVFENQDKNGYTLDSLNKDYQLYIAQLNLERRKEGKERLDVVREIKRTTFFHWRVNIWEMFGLKILNPKQDNYYLLTNPELLDESSTLRQVINLLVDDEERGSQTGTLIFSKRGRKSKQPVSPSGTGMTFVSAGNNNIDYENPQFGYQFMEEPEMVGVIQFAMKFGEALVMEYSKVLSKEDKAYWNYKPEELFVLEPQQLTLINGRWYVAGYLYPYGDREHPRTMVYDVNKIKLTEKDDVDSPHYQVQDGFDIYDYLPSDWSEYFESDKVVSMYLRAAGSLLDKEPFCEAQEKTDVNVGMLYTLYKVYLKPDENLFVQYLAYGDELTAYNPYDKIEKTTIDINERQISYLRNLRKLDFK